jgi:hypothetical protein
MGNAVGDVRAPAAARSSGDGAPGAVSSSPALESEGRPMIHPSDPETRRPVAVRDGHGAPVTCSACGCRLKAGTADNDIAWFHFNPLGGRDARGCRVDCVDAPHDVAGYRAASLALA